MNTGTITAKDLNDNKRVAFFMRHRYYISVETSIVGIKPDSPTTYTVLLDDGTILPTVPFDATFNVSYAPASTDNFYIDSFEIKHGFLVKVHGTIATHSATYSTDEIRFEVWLHEIFDRTYDNNDRRKFEVRNDVAFGAKNLEPQQAAEFGRAILTASRMSVKWARIFWQNVIAYENAVKADDEKRRNRAEIRDAVVAEFIEVQDNLTPAQARTLNTIATEALRYDDPKRDYRSYDNRTVAKLHEKGFVEQDGTLFSLVFETLKKKVEDRINQ